MSKLFEVLSVMQGLGAVFISLVVGFQLVFSSEKLTTADWTFLVLALLVGAVFFKGIANPSKEPEAHRGKDS